VAALLLLWLAVSRGRRPTVAAVDTAVAAGNVALDTAASRTSAAMTAAGGAVSDAARELGAFGKKLLPGGVELNIPERGIESKLIAFIEDKSRPVNDTTWFNFDRLNFATGSATILPESEEQLNNIASVLTAYPNVNVKIGGYTDNTGDASSNRQLSQQRADAVRQTLIGKGIDPKRMQAEGYGSQHAVGDNATEEGRAKNRRIALRVTKK
jgi:outer membrane protein OmpA-like peptidoglycan-associated protein